MLAARLERPGLPLEVKRVPPPELVPGGARVAVRAAQVLPFSHAVLAGGFPFRLPTPYTFGSSAVGVVQEVDEGISGPAVGDLVFCDPYVVEENRDGNPARMIIGWFALDEAASGAQRRWHDGAFAEQAVYPADRCTPLTGLEATSAERLACLNYFNIAYGGLRAGGLRAGQTVIVTGATGNLGTAAVLDALAMGAGAVIAAGRNRRVLAELADLDPTRVRTVVLAGDAAADATALEQAATTPGQAGADLALDCVGLAEHADHVHAALSALAPGGCLVVIGGVGAALALDYQTLLARELTVRGAFMGPRNGPAELAALARAGLLRLDRLRPQVFPLARVQEAVDAAREGRGLEFTVLAVAPATAT
jgi:alcohol dehydrogenase